MGPMKCMRTRSMMTVLRRVDNTELSEADKSRALRLYFGIDCRCLSNCGRYYRHTYADLARIMGLGWHPSVLINIVRRSGIFSLSAKLDKGGLPEWIESDYLNVNMPEIF